MRPAPIQVSYMGFPGTTGADYIDYLVTDEVHPQLARFANHLFNCTHQVPDLLVAVLAFGG